MEMKKAERILEWVAAGWPGIDWKLEPIGGNEGWRLVGRRNGCLVFGTKVDPENLDPEDIAAQIRKEIPNDVGRLLESLEREVPALTWRVSDRREGEDPAWQIRGDSEDRWMATWVEDRLLLRDATLDRLVGYAREALRDVLSPEETLPLRAAPGSVERIDELRRYLVEAEERILGTKRSQYADGDLPLRNFREVGGMVNLAPAEVCLTYLMKHIQAIANAVTLNQGRLAMTLEDGSEGLLQRFLDARAYLVLLAALIDEDEAAG